MVGCGVSIAAIGQLYSSLVEQGKASGFSANKRHLLISIADSFLLGNTQCPTPGKRCDEWCEGQNGVSDMVVK